MSAPAPWLFFAPARRSRPPGHSRRSGMVLLPLGLFALLGMAPAAPADTVFPQAASQALRVALAEVSLPRPVRAPYNIVLHDGGPGPGVATSAWLADGGAAQAAHHAREGSFLRVAGARSPLAVHDLPAAATAPGASGGAGVQSAPNVPSASTGATAAVAAALPAALPGTLANALPGAEQAAPPRPPAPAATTPAPAATTPATARKAAAAPTVADPAPASTIAATPASALLAPAPQADRPATAGTTPVGLREAVPAPSAAAPIELPRSADLALAFQRPTPLLPLFTALLLLGLFGLIAPRLWAGLGGASALARLRQGLRAGTRRDGLPDAGHDDLQPPVPWRKRLGDGLRQAWPAALPWRRRSAPQRRFMDEQALDAWEDYVAQR